MKKRFFGEEKRRYQSVGTWVRKGSATMEYIILIAVGVLFAGLLYLAMSDGEGLIQSAMEKKVQETIQGRLPEGDLPSGNTPGIGGSPGIGNTPGLGDSRDIGGNPEISGSPDAGIPPERSGSSDSTSPADVNPEADGMSPSTSGGGSSSATSDGNASASTSPTESGEEGGLSGWWNKTKNYVASGQILKDAGHVGKETLDFLVLDDASGCFTGKDTDGNQMAGWECGLSCVSLVPVVGEPRFEHAYLWNAFLLMFEGVIVVFLFMMVLTFVISPLFTQEVKTEMDSIILCSVKGRREIVTAKLLSAGVTSAIISVVYLVAFFIGTWLGYGDLSGIDASIRSLNGFEFSSLNMTVGGAVLLAAGWLVFVAICFGLVLSLISALTKSQSAAFGIGIVVLLAGAMLNYLGDRWRKLAWPFADF